MQSTGDRNLDSIVPESCWRKAAFLYIYQRHLSRGEEILDCQSPLQTIINKLLNKMCCI